MSARLHTFSAVAFVENLPLRELARVFSGARVSAHELCLAVGEEGRVFAYPFGAIVFQDVSGSDRDALLDRLRESVPRLTTETVREDFVVREEPQARMTLAGGALVVDRLNAPRAGVVALVVAQSAAMEYYERIVETSFARTSDLVARLETRGTVPLGTRQLHRFIGEAIGTRSEVLSVLHLLDKPDATWDDPAMDEIYGDLRGEFDLMDRYSALERKLQSIQEALELVLGVARDRRLILLEAAIGVLILLEIVLSFVRLR
jgi:uncharacterized Rmd1/YagE family protein